MREHYRNNHFFNILDNGITGSTVINHLINESLPVCVCARARAYSHAHVLILLPTKFILLFLASANSQLWSFAK